MIAIGTQKRDLQIRLRRQECLLREVTLKFDFSFPWNVPICMVSPFHLSRLCSIVSSSAFSMVELAEVLYHVSSDHDLPCQTVRSSYSLCISLNTGGSWHRDTH